MEGAAMTDGIKYIGADRFVITEDRLKELLEAEVTSQAANELGLYDGVRWDEILSFMYPDEGVTPYDVADSLVGRIPGLLP